MRESPLHHYLYVLRRQAWLIILIPVIAVAGAAILVSQQEKIYRSSMKIVVVQSGGEVQPEFGNLALMQTMRDLLENNVVSTSVIRKLNLDTTPEKLQKRLRASFAPDSAVLDVKLDWPDKRKAVEILNEVAAVYTKLVDTELGVRSSGDATVLGRRSNLPVIGASVFDPAHLEPGTVAPKPVRTLGFAGILGLALGLVLAFLRESLDLRIRGRSEAEEAFGAPVIGTLPRGTLGKPPPGTSPNGRRDEALVEAMRVLSVKVELSQAALDGPAILVTSAVNDEGKSTVAANLGAALAIGGKDVVCIEADMRKPQLSRYLGVEPRSRGLAEVLQGEIEPEEALQRVRLFAPSLDGAARSRVPLGGAEPDGRLRVLTAGQVTADPAGLITPESTGSLIAKLRDTAQFVIFDSAPLLLIADAIPPALQSDSVLVVAREGKTTKDKAEAMREMLDSLGVRTTAVVLTEARAVESYGYY